MIWRLPLAMLYFDFISSDFVFVCTNSCCHVWQLLIIQFAIWVKRGRWWAWCWSQLLASFDFGLIRSICIDVCTLTWSIVRLFIKIELTVVIILAQLFCQTSTLQHLVFVSLESCLVGTNTGSPARFLKEVELTRSISLTGIPGLCPAPLHELSVSSVFISVSTFVWFWWNFGFVGHHTAFSWEAALFGFGFAWIYKSFISSVFASMCARTRSCAWLFWEVQDAVSVILTLLRRQLFTCINFGFTSTPFLEMSAYSRLWAWFFFEIQLASRILAAFCPCKGFTSLNLGLIATEFLLVSACARSVVLLGQIIQLARAWGCAFCSTSQAFTILDYREAGAELIGMRTFSRSRAWFLVEIVLTARISFTAHRR